MTETITKVSRTGGLKDKQNSESVGSPDLILQQHDQPHTHGVVLVSGHHRSGSTWVGQILSAHEAIRSIDEPFNPLVTGRKQPFQGWYHYVVPEESARFESYMRKVMSKERLGREPGRRLLQTLISCTPFTSRDRRRVLLKDPIALFSAEWIARTFGAQVVLLIRHPAAFIGSLKRMKWTVNFANLLNQPALLNDCLGDFRDELERRVRAPRDVIEDGILQWRVFAHTIDRLRKAHPEWLVYRHEDASREPEACFNQILSSLGLQMTSEVESAIHFYGGKENPSEAERGKLHELRRNSAENIHNWMKRLSPEEIRRIRTGTEDIAGSFYPAEDWSEGGRD